ncbi:hypothetical protein KR009_011772 [Drosophila setifemur]|nr:hypothetical protein KR009_011772 [Drosophila setifemur]
MDQSKNFLHNVANLAGQLRFSQLERSAMAYKRLCLELESLSNTALPSADPVPVPTPAPVPTQGLRASASEFVPQVPPTGDRRAVELEEEQYEYSDEVDEGYEMERNMSAPRTSIYGFRFSDHLYESEDGSESHSEAEKRRKLSYRATKFRPNQPKTDVNSMPPKELTDGQPHFKGPYMPLLQHRIANADAYGLIRGPSEGPSLLLEDMIKQLSRLDNCPINLNSFFRGRNLQNSSS